MTQEQEPRSELSARLELGLRAAFGRGGEESVLEVVSRATGADARLSLPASPENGGAQPGVGAGEGEVLPLPTGRGSYRLLGRLGRGGMGEVLEAQDLDLGRNVAMKVLPLEHRSDPAMLRRFVEEAQVGGQLQHPGIVPVYELGLMADQRPYFTMKLVRGRTLAALLAERSDPAAERLRFLGILESVCQTVAYAHSRGVIHRDLKPSNVMVGAFGEVQVVDWGLAKVLRKGAQATPPPRVPEDVLRIETVRSRTESGGTDSLNGAVIGTPACMPPEQARGEVERLDERSDVFALGGILAQILTGRAVYTGSGSQMLKQALRGELAPIREALAVCGADPELVGLCLECLSSEPGERPGDAGEVARRLREYLTSIEERARSAQIEAAEARVRAQAERRARRLTVGLAASALVAVLAVGGGGMWVALQRAEQRRERLAQVDAALAEANLALGQEHWSEAASAARRAQALMTDDTQAEDLAAKLRAAEGIAAQADDAARGEELDDGNRAFLAALRELRQPEGDELYPTDWAELEASFRALFAAQGLPVEGEEESASVAALQSRGIPVELASALDEWALVRRKAEDGEGAGRLWSLADTLDPDAERVELRRAIRAGDAEALKGRIEGVDTMPAATVELLGRTLAGVGASEEAVDVYRMALLRWPDEFVLHVELARLLSSSDPAEAVGHYRAALALRPESVEVRHELGIALVALDRARKTTSTERVPLWRETIELAPQDAHLQLHMAWQLLREQRASEALSYAQRARELDPDSPLAYVTIGRITRFSGVEDMALHIEVWRRAIDLAPDLEEPHWRLADALIELRRRGGDKGGLEEAIECYRRALTIHPQCVLTLRKLAWALWVDGQQGEVIETYRRVIDLEPLQASKTPLEQAAPTDALGEAMACYSESLPVEQFSMKWPVPISLQANDRLMLAMALSRAERDVEAAEVMDSLATVAPDIGGWAKFMIVPAYQRLGRSEDVLESYAGHLELHPDCSWGLRGMAGALDALGRWQEAEVHLRRILERGWVGHPEWDESDLGLWTVMGDLGSILYKRGEDAEAIEWIERALAHPKASALSRACLQSTYAEILLGATDPFFHDIDAAEHHARQGVLLATGTGGSSSFHHDDHGQVVLGAVLCRKGEYEQGVELLAPLLEKEPDIDNEYQRELGFYLAMALQHLGQPQAAREQYRRTVEACAKHPPVSRRLRLRAEAAQLLGIDEGSGQDPSRDD